MCEPVENPSRDRLTGEIEVTPPMMEAGSHVIVAEPGVAEIGVFFSPTDLAKKVYEAMERRRLSDRDRRHTRSLATRG